MATVLTRHFDHLSALAALPDVPDEVTVTSTLRGDRYTVVAIGGSVDPPAIQLLTAYFAGLLNAGTRRLVVDLSRVERPPAELLDLMRKVEAKTVARNGMFELTGLTPAVLYAMDDEPVAQLFAGYRTLLELGGPLAVAWAALRCPQGLSDVPEPGTPARHRAYIGTSELWRRE